MEGGPRSVRATIVDELESKQYRKVDRVEVPVCFFIVLGVRFVEVQEDLI